LILINVNLEDWVAESTKAIVNHSLSGIRWCHKIVSDI
jgi:hypothetical protein